MGGLSPADNAWPAAAPFCLARQMFYLEKSCGGTGGASSTVRTRPNWSYSIRTPWRLSTPNL